MKTNMIKWAGMMAIGCACMGSVRAEAPAIAIVDFTTERDVSRRDIAPKLQQFLEKRIISSGLFTVVEREKLNSVMREAMFQQSGVVDPATAVALGRQLGARYLMTGSILDANTETRSFQGYGTSIRTATMRVTAEVKIIDLERNVPVAAFEEEGSEVVHSGAGLQVNDPKAFTTLSRDMADRFLKQIRAAPFLQASQPVERAKYKVLVQSEPAGADVEIDGKYYGNAGREIALDEGDHVIKVSLAGYEEWTKRVPVGENVSFKATLKKIQDPDLKVEVKKQI